MRSSSSMKRHAYSGPERCAKAHKSKSIVNTLSQNAAQLLLPFKKKNIFNTSSIQTGGRRKPCWTSANYQYITTLHF